jgi:hypothetical protein
MVVQVDHHIAVTGEADDQVGDLSGVQPAPVDQRCMRPADDWRDARVLGVAGLSGTEEEADRYRRKTGPNGGREVDVTLRRHGRMGHVR